MKKIIFPLAALILAGCSTEKPIDISSSNSFGLKCSNDASTSPDWNHCMENAKQTCGARQVINAVQHDPTGSGAADDGYFLSFQCGS